MRLTILISVLLLSIGGNAQNVAFKKSNFKDNKDALEQALNNIEQGDVWLEKGKAKVLRMENAFDEFNNALEFYLPAQEFNPNNADLNRKIGHSYLYTNTPYLAMPFLKTSLELAGEDATPFVYFLLGKAYQLERNFNEGEKSFLKYGTLEKDKKLEPYKKLNRKHIKECKSGAEIFGKKTRVWVDNVKELNTPSDEIAPSITADNSEIIFNSNKTGDFDIYTAERQKRRWIRLSSVVSLNTDGDDVSSNLAYDGQRILLFKDNDG